MIGRECGVNKPLAEFIGTFALVFFGCGAAVIGGMGTGPTAINLLGIAIAFGLAIVAMAYGIGPISGCHVNPAVSFGVFVAGRMKRRRYDQLWIAQVLGAIVGAVVLYIILSGKAQGWNGGLGQNGWGAGYIGEYNVFSAFVFEVVATFLFLVCILGVTHPFAPAGFAGLAIGLTLVVIHLVGINVTGISVNPARSIGPALIGVGSNPNAVAQLWLFIIAPLIGAGARGCALQGTARLLDAEEELNGTSVRSCQRRAPGQKPAMLHINDLTYRLGERLLIDHATVALPTGARVGLVGRNGAGKTTLFRLDPRRDSPECGSIAMPRQTPASAASSRRRRAAPQTLIDFVLDADVERARCSRRPRRASDPHRIAEIQTRLVDIDAHAAPARAARILAGLGFDEAAQNRALAEFSGGWRMRVALAAVLFSAPDLLLLDEPTNYLDLEGALWLVDYLKTYPATVIVISHDRDLLDDVADHILHLDSGKLTLWSGGYSSFERQRARAAGAAAARRPRSRRSGASICKPSSTASAPSATKATPGAVAPQDAGQDGADRRRSSTRACCRSAWPPVAEAA